MMDNNKNNEYDDLGSQDLFSSQDTSQGTSINEQIDLTLQLTEFIWVQCDHPDCQKWRRIPVANGDDLGDDPWYCSMNPDPTMNSCQAVEEDHRRYDRMAKKAGVKFVMSMLNVGTLVWARTTGYCRWPGIVTPDPMTGVHIHLDIDGDPHSYHVEYLGNPHTHSWVIAKYVEVYGHKEDEKTTVTKIVKTGLKKGRKKLNRSSLDTSGSKTKRRTSYRRTRVDDVMKEADYLLDMTFEERMYFSVFKYDPKKLANMEMVAAKHEKKRCSNCGENPLKKRKKLKEAQESTQGICNMLGIADHAVSRKMVIEEKRSGDVKSCGKTSMGNSKKRPKYSSPRTATMVELSATRKSKPGAGSVSVLDSPNQFSQSKLKISSSMMNVTKEEKFKIDIDVYMKNERAFEHDVRRFMRRNDRTIRSTPVWHNVPVSLFQLFLAVHERGGFMKVCESKGWAGIYKELTDMHNAKNGHVAKHYYERNLYPYELFITGKDFTKALEKFESVKPGPKKKAETDVKVDINNNGVENVTSDYASYCSDIEAILTQLDEDYKAALIDNECKNEMKKKLGVGLTFHDETSSTPSFKFAAVPSEFHQTPNDQASCTSTEQKVPSTGGVVKEDDDLTLDVVEQKILTEMKALEDQMREMNEEIGELLD